MTPGRWRFQYFAGDLQCDTKQVSEELQRVNCSAGYKAGLNKNGEPVCEETRRSTCGNITCEQDPDVDSENSLLTVQVNGDQSAEPMIIISPANASLDIKGHKVERQKLETGKWQVFAPPTSSLPHHAA